MTNKHTLFLCLLMLGMMVTFSMQAKPKKVLIYIKNGKGFVHKNRENSVKALTKICTENKIAVDVSEDPSLFTEENLKQYDALIFSNTNNEVFDTDEQRLAFQRYIQAGGAFVGIHSATGSERDWPWFWKMIGGKFKRHAPNQDFAVRVIDKNHPSTSFLPETYERTRDECYYHTQLNPDIHVLLAADLTTVKDPKSDEYPFDIFGERFPVAWCHEFDGGRQWYTSLGHQIEHYDDPIYQQHLLGGILWALDKKGKKDYSKATTTLIINE